MVERGAERALDRYEATTEGIEEFRDWLRTSSAAPLALRDAVHAKLELAGEEDVPDLILAIREEERACALEFAAASSRLNLEWQLQTPGAAERYGLEGQSAERPDDRRSDAVGDAGQAPAAPAARARRPRRGRSPGRRR